MNSFFSFFPDANVLLRKTPDEVAPVLLPGTRTQREKADRPVSTQGIALRNRQTLDAVEREDVSSFQKGKGMWIGLVGPRGAGSSKEEFIEPVSGRNGQNGWHDLTEEGREPREEARHQAISVGARFPEEGQHPAIRERGANALMRSATPGSEGELVSAVRDALITVEDTGADGRGFV